MEHGTCLSPEVSLIYDFTNDSGILQSDLFTRSQNVKRFPYVCVAALVCWRLVPDENTG